MPEPIADLSPALSALDARSYLVQLEAERVLAVEEGLADNRAFMQTSRPSSITSPRLRRRRSDEIASLGGELFRPQVG